MTKDEILILVTRAGFQYKQDWALAVEAILAGTPAGAARRTVDEPPTIAVSSLDAPAYVVAHEFAHLLGGFPGLEEIAGRNLLKKERKVVKSVMIEELVAAIVGMRLIGKDITKEDRLVYADGLHSYIEKQAEKLNHGDVLKMKHMVIERLKKVEELRRGCGK